MQLQPLTLTGCHPGPQPWQGAASRTRAITGCLLIALCSAQPSNSLTQKAQRSQRMGTKGSTHTNVSLLFWGRKQEKQYLPVLHLKEGPEAGLHASRTPRPCITATPKRQPCDTALTPVPALKRKGLIKIWDYILLKRCNRQEGGEREKYGLKKVPSKFMHCRRFTTLINSVISKTILFMFHLPHQKCKGKKKKKTTHSDAKIIPQGIYF